MKYIIGIDLGTTNCTMSYAGEDEKIHQFKISQWVSKELFEESPFLPSFLYFPLNDELEEKYVLGTFARERGSEVPDRLISSAKSWLCHGNIDRREKILPINGDEKMSPLEVCTELLRHMKEAWDAKMAKHPFIEQEILVTVPASFDPSARQLVQEATELAGFPETILLEEPQAAFYSWLYENEWRKILHVGDQILIVDIGGGTTDFSLISVEDQEGNLTLKRESVGDHLLLGGDNIDLALAYLTKGKIEEHDLDDWQFQALLHQCRKAKEILLEKEAPSSVEITIMGRGSRLIGNSISTQLERNEVREIVLKGFFPIVSQDENTQENHTGIQEVGLPYASDPRITAQLAKFLSKKAPQAVLFNGGTMRSETFRERIIELLNEWGEVKELQGANLDFGVSRGAVAYGLARNGKGIRIKSGTSHSYFIGVEDAVPAVPGIPKPLKGICVVPFGMEEGSEETLDEHSFALVVGEHATFRFFSSGKEFEVGTVVRNWKKDLKELHPIETILERGEEDGKTVLVKIKSRVTELGVLELWCVADDGRKWNLEFDLRREELLLNT